MRAVRLHRELREALAFFVMRGFLNNARRSGMVRYLAAAERVDRAEIRAPIGWIDRSRQADHHGQQATLDDNPGGNLALDEARCVAQCG